jgi:single-strand DNA-binding protein
MFQNVIMVGRLTKDPELKYTPSGIAVSTFRVAVDRPFTNAQGEREADFFNVVAWRQTAEFAANYLNKGRLVLIEGRMQNRSWQDQAGQRREKTEFIVDVLKALDRPKQESVSGGNEAVPAGVDISDYDPLEDE